MDVRNIQRNNTLSSLNKKSTVKIFTKPTKVKVEEDK